MSNLLAPRDDRIMRTEDDTYPNLFQASGLGATHLYRKTVVAGQLATSLADVQFQPTATQASADWSFGLAPPYTATYTGSKTKKMMIVVSANWVRMSNSDCNAFIGIYVNDVFIDGKAQAVKGANGDSQVVAVQCIAPIAQGQTLRVQCSSTGLAELDPVNVITTSTQTSVACSLTAYEIFA